MQQLIPDVLTDAPPVTTATTPRKSCKPLECACLRLNSAILKQTQYVSLLDEKELKLTWKVRRYSGEWVKTSHEMHYRTMRSYICVYPEQRRHRYGYV